MECCIFILEQSSTSKVRCPAIGGENLPILCCRRELSDGILDGRDLTYHERRYLNALYERRLLGLSETDNFDFEKRGGIDLQEHSNALDIAERDIYDFEERDAFDIEGRDLYDFDERKTFQLDKRGSPKPPANGSPPSSPNTPSKGPDVKPAMKQALALCKKSTKPKHRKRADRFFEMEGPPVSANIAGGDHLYTRGLCGCWVVVIMSKTQAIATHIPHGKWVPNAAGTRVQTITSEQQATLQVNQLVTAHRAHPIQGAWGYILKHEGADPDSTRIIEGALQSAGLSVQSKTYTTAEVERGGNFRIKGAAGRDPTLLLDGEPVAHR